MVAREFAVSGMRTGRRAFVAGGLCVVLAAPARAQTLRLEVWRDPNCGCCEGWVEHIRKEGFSVADRVVPSVSPFRRMLGTPIDLLSCHVARVDGLAIEGHVPALAIRRMLAERTPEVAGLAVPAMPIGTPGMEIEGREPEVYAVVVWDRDGSHRPWLRMRGASVV
jgi:hypothetical protein